MSFSLLGLVNLLTRKDARSRRIAANVAFGSDPRQRLDIYAPKTTTGPLPVMVFIYGGSWVDGDRRDYSFAGRALAGLGYVVAVVDYRVIPQVEYPAFLEDNVAAVAWVASNIAAHGGDPSRITLAGHSAGAYNCVMLALDPRYLKRAGLSDRIRAVVGLSGPYDFFPFDVPETLRAFGAVRDGRTTQPLTYVTADAPPMFLATGDSDKLVYPRNTVALSAALRQAGVAVDEKHYAGLTHPSTLLALGSVLRGKMSVLDDLAAFLVRHA